MKSTTSNEYCAFCFFIASFIGCLWDGFLLLCGQHYCYYSSKFHNGGATQLQIQRPAMMMNLNYLAGEPDLGTMEVELPLCRRRPETNDRFIPNRHATQMGFHSLDIPTGGCPYEKLIADNVLRRVPEHSRIVNYRQKASQQPSIKEVLHDLFLKKSAEPVNTHNRVIPSLPEKILDAPELMDDYYLNLLDWSCSGQLAIGLNKTVYLYTPTEINELCKLQDAYVCSISFHPHTPLVSVGNSLGSIDLYDMQRRALVRTLTGHQKRVSSLSFSNILYSGSKDTQILMHDVKSQNSIVGKLNSHKGEVCGLALNSNGLVSGSNDNTAMIWDLAMGRLRHTLNGHKAAVKALAWCPWQRNLLATGGGSKDKCIKFWNVETGKCINTVNTESQVSALIWNPTEKQILSAHGFSHNQLCLWKYSDMSKVAELYGHTQRILHVAASPDKQTICSASADQTLRFWRVFENQPTQGLFSKASNHLSPCRLR